MLWSVLIKMLLLGCLELSLQWELPAKEALINVCHTLVLHSTAATIHQDIAILTVTATVLIH